MFQGWDCDSCHEFRPQRYCLSLGVEVIYSLALHTSRCKPIQTYWSWITRLDSCNFVLWFLFRFLVHFSLLHAEKLEENLRKDLGVEKERVLDDLEGL
ncbi:uncharacterized protein LOC128195490 isoform X2 [Vigna angularis]|uniref:uncharacterized protein LOC128195490 isoform X2 n=1 Tax=Phaseolus angularis TaxID=3914 RepID=UPI0022B3377F|nr:uncharacterized protein LOC128195490 isoform X2 [Vigna angularis]